MVGLYPCFDICLFEHKEREMEKGKREAKQLLCGTRFLLSLLVSLREKNQNRKFCVKMVSRLIEKVVANWHD